jgi:hypothetical protein
MFFGSRATIIQRCHYFNLFAPLLLNATASMAVDTMNSPNTVCGGLSPSSLLLAERLHMRWLNLTLADKLNGDNVLKLKVTVRDCMVPGIMV